MSSNGTKYEDDALKMTSETTVDEVQSFVRRRTQNPYIVGGKVIWNFSNHKPDMEALEFAANNKLENDKYVIPFQVTGSWGFMVQFLPQQLQRSEILVYKQQYGDYAAYTNLAAKLTEEELQEWRREAASDLEMLNLNEE